jgi:hypothetical protein
VLIKDFNQMLETVVKPKPEALKAEFFKTHNLFLRHFSTLFKLELGHLQLTEKEINIMCALTHSGPEDYAHNVKISNIDLKLRPYPQFITQGMIISEGYLSYLDLCSVG